MWAVLAVPHHSDIKRDHDRVGKYTQYENELKFNDVEFSIKKMNS